jgi:hypothetical protein
MHSYGFEVNLTPAVRLKAKLGLSRFGSSSAAVCCKAARSNKSQAGNCCHSLCSRHRVGLVLCDSKEFVLVHPSIFSSQVFVCCCARTRQGPSRQHCIASPYRAFQSMQSLLQYSFHCTEQLTSVPRVYMQHCFRNQNCRSPSMREHFYT